MVYQKRKQSAICIGCWLEGGKSEWETAD